MSKRIIFHQAFAYSVVGAIQWAVDWACFVALTLLGAGVVPGNLAARVVGALLGFWLNGRYTFASDSRRVLVGRRLARFVAAWIPLTAASTLGVHLLNAQQGLQSAWIGKPLLDAALAGAGFLIARRWIYR